MFLRRTLALLFTIASCLSASSEAATRKHMFQTTDNVGLIADIYSPDDKQVHPTVLLLHMLARGKEDYQPLLEPLQKAGFIVVNVDLRGHGGSTHQGAKLISYKSFRDTDWLKLPDDAEVVLKNLKGTPGVDRNKIVIVGASIGANAALMAAAKDSDVKAVVALSPGLDFHGLKPEPALHNYNKPVLFIASADDKYSLQSATELHVKEKSSQLNAYPNGGHGTQMLVTHPDLSAQIATWLAKAVGK